MDIQKEREAFEQHLTDTGLVEFAGYGFAVDECDEYLHEPTQVAWDSWLIGLSRTKAQAVPEGFVALAVDDVERVFRCLDDHAIYITYKASDALENIRKAMIEAQEQKG